jgi:hypothetical protein
MLTRGATNATRPPEVGTLNDPVNPPLAEVDEGSIVYPLMDNFIDTFVPAVERYRGFCEAMLSIPIDLLVRNGKERHIAALVTLTKTMSDKLEDNMSSLDRAVVALLSNAVVVKVEQDVLAAVAANAASTSTEAPK